MFGFFKKWQRANIRRKIFHSVWREVLKANFEIYKQLSFADQQEIQTHILVFLAEKKFEGCGGLEINDEIRVTIAAQACLLLIQRK